MCGDPVPGLHDMLRLWYRLPQLKGKERAEAIARLEEWLKKVERRNEPQNRRRRARYYQVY